MGKALPTVVLMSNGSGRRMNGARNRIIPFLQDHINCSGENIFSTHGEPCMEKKLTRSVQFLFYC